MPTIRKSLSTLMLIVALLLGGIGLALYAADSTPKKPTPKETLDPLLEQSQWKIQWVETAQAYQIAFKGPDVWVRVSGDYIVVHSYIGRVARDVSATDLMHLLRKNYDLYEGKFAIDKDLDLWFMLSTPKRILDGQELNKDIGYVAAAAGSAATLIKTTKPAVIPATPKP